MEERPVRRFNGFNWLAKSNPGQIGHYRSTFETLRKESQLGPDPFRPLIIPKSMVKPNLSRLRRRPW